MIKSQEFPTVHRFLSRIGPSYQLLKKKLSFQLEWRTTLSWLSYIVFISAQLAWAVEYTDCISAEGYGSFNEYPGYDIKPSDSKAPINGALGNIEYPFIAIAPRFTFALIGSYQWVK